MPLEALTNVQAEAFPKEPSFAFLKARLLAAINPPSTSAHDRRPDPSEVLAAAAPLTDPSKRGLLDPYLHLISPILSSYYTTTPVPEEDIGNLSATLATCCLFPQSLAIQKEMVNRKASTVAGKYSDWLLYEARSGDPARINAVLDSFEAQLALMGDSRLLVLLAGAWAVLRAAAGRTELPNLSVQLPYASTVSSHIAKTGCMNDDVAAQVARLFPNPEHVAFPETVEALQRTLLGFRERNNVDAMLDLWKKWCDEPPKDLPRGEVLAKFLHAARWRPTAVMSAGDRDALRSLGKEVMKRMPSPTPLPVVQVLLSTAGDYEQDKPRDKKIVVPSAVKTWNQARKEKVPLDLKTHMIYMGVLGNYHADALLFKAWEELVDDARCKAIYEKEAADEKPGKVPESWPPVAALNQVLSMAYTIGGDAAIRADDLFLAAIEGSIATKPDLITINTALRFAAHMADVQKMNAIIAAAASLGLKPDIVTYTTLVQGLLRANEHDLALRTLDAMKASGIEPNERMAATLIDDLTEGGTREGLRAAEDVLRDMRRRGVKLTVFIWTALISGYFRGNWVLDGWSAIERMRKQGLRFNVVGYNSLLRIVTDGDRSARNQYRRAASEDLKTAPEPLAIKLFRQMLDDGVVPNADTYAILLGGFLRTQRDAEALEVLKDVDARGFQTNKQALQSMIKQARALQRGGGRGRGRGRAQ